MYRTETINILLIEDDPGDVELTREGLKTSKVLIDFQVVDDGVKALQYLRNQGAYADANRPDIILLDLNLPKKDGREVLKEIKSDVGLKSIPVVVLTTSDADQDIARCYLSGANCYITKPVGFDGFMKMVSSLDEFWFTIVRLPKGK